LEKIMPDYIKRTNEVVKLFEAIIKE